MNRRSGSPRDSGDCAWITAYYNLFCQLGAVTRHLAAHSAKRSRSPVLGSLPTSMEEILPE